MVEVSTITTSGAPGTRTFEANVQTIAGSNTSKLSLWYYELWCPNLQTRINHVLCLILLGHLDPSYFFSIFTVLFCTPSDIALEPSTPTSAMLLDSVRGDATNKTQGHACQKFQPLGPLLFVFLLFVSISKCKRSAVEKLVPTCARRHDL